LSCPSTRRRRKAPHPAAGDAIRDLLDGESLALVTQDRELRRAIDGLARPPALVVTDSQAFLKSLRTSRAACR